MILTPICQLWLWAGPSPLVSMPERHLVKERSRSSQALCGTAALAIFPVEGKNCCCQCGGSCVSEGVDSKVSFVRKAEVTTLGCEAPVLSSIHTLKTYENGSNEIAFNQTTNLLGSR